MRKYMLLIVVMLAGVALSGCTENIDEENNSFDEGDWYESESTPDGENPEVLENPAEAEAGAGSKLPLPAWLTPEEIEARKNLRVPRAGVSSYPPESHSTPKAMIGSADDALYSAKRDGGDCVRKAT